MAFASSSAQFISKMKSQFWSGQQFLSENSQPGNSQSGNPERACLDFQDAGPAQVRYQFSVPVEFFIWDLLSHLGSGVVLNFEFANGICIEIEHSESTFSGEFSVVHYRARDGNYFLIIVLYFDRTLIRVLCQVCFCYQFLFPRIQRHYTSITFQASSMMMNFHRDCIHMVQIVLSIKSFGISQLFDLRTYCSFDSAFGFRFFQAGDRTCFYQQRQSGSASHLFDTIIRFVMMTFSVKESLSCPQALS